MDREAPFMHLSTNLISFLMSGELVCGFGPSDYAESWAKNGNSAGTAERAKSVYKQKISIKVKFNFDGFQSLSCDQNT